MLSDTEIAIALEHCEAVKRTYPVRFLQVLPDPVHISNVKLRIGQGRWHTLHVTDAITVLRNMLRKQRRTRLYGLRTQHLRKHLEKVDAQKKQLGIV